MPDETARIKELLALHGADVSQWPEHVVRMESALLAHSDFPRLCEEERDFEALLRLRPEPDVSATLAHRILASSYGRPQSASGFAESMASLRPVAAAAMLLIGFVIGFDMATPVHLSSVGMAQSNAVDDESAIL